MTRVLYIGRHPEPVDFTDSTLAAGATAEQIHARIALALVEMAKRGWNADLCLIQPGETAVPELQRQLTARDYDWVMIATGIRRSPVSLFEDVINAVHSTAPGAVIAFNSQPEDSADGVARRLDRRSASG